MKPEFTRCPNCGAMPRPEARFCGRCGVALPGNSRLQTVAEGTIGPVASSGDDGAPFAPGSRVATRYQVVRRLGTGGFGDTYLADDLQLERPCVLKRLRVKPTWSDEECRQHLASFNHEARLLASLNHPGHPNIPDIYDYLPAQHCLVMKYVAGVSLAEHLERQGRVPVETALRYAHEVCAALVYMHTHGREPVLHRDIKPANILIDSRGRIWLIDFGLAYAPTTATDRFVGAGTPGYAPLEQWQGHAEPRSDVYALAMTLTTLLTGERPATLPSSAELLPPALAALRSDLPPQAFALLDRARARAVEQRPSAAEFFVELALLIEYCTLVPPPAPRPPPLATAFVGRTDEVRDLTHRLAERPTLLLCGPPGVGKTALAATLARQIVPVTQIWWYPCRAQTGDDALLRSLADFLAWHGHTEPWRLVQAARQSVRPPPAPEHLLALLLQTLRHAAGTPPLLLVLDDLHLLAKAPLVQQLWAELQTFAQAERLWLLATARMVPPFAAEQTVVTVGGLAAAATDAFLSTQRLTLAAADIADLTAVTGGNPQLLLLAAEVLRQTTAPVANTIKRLATSDNIERFLLREVDAGLGAAERAVMETVAVLLEEGGTREAVAALTGESVGQPLRDLVERGLVLVQANDGERTYSQHGILRDFCLAQLGMGAKKRLHRHAAAYYTREEPDPLIAARHHALADEHEAAATLVTGPTTVQRLVGQGRARALEQLLAGLPTINFTPDLAVASALAHAEVLTLLGDYPQARALLDRSLAEGAAADEVAPVRQIYRLRLLGRIAEQTGAYERAERHGRAALALAQTLALPSNELAQMYAEVALVLMRRGQLSAATEMCQVGLAVLPRQPAFPRERAALLYRRATIAGESGDYAGAIAALEQTLELARAVGDLVLTAGVLHNLGIYCARRGEHGRALAYNQEGLVLAEQIGDLVGQATSLDQMGGIMMDQGDFAASMRFYKAGQVLSERLGLREDLAWTLSNLGQLHFIQGQFAPARTYLEQAKQLHEQLGNPGGLADTCYRLGDVALASGDHATAQAHGATALAMARQAQNGAYESCALRVLGEAALAEGALQVACRHLAAALWLQRRIGDPYDTALILAAAARLAHAHGNPQKAARRVQRGLALAQRAAIPFVLACLEAVEREVTGQ